MKKGYKPLATTVLIGIVAPTVGTDAFFEGLEIQPGTPNFLFNIVRAVTLLAFLLVAMRYVYWFVDLITFRYRILAVFISIINPLIALFTFILIYTKIQALPELSQTNAGQNAIGQLFSVILLAGLLVMQGLIEYHCLKKLRDHIQHAHSPGQTHEETL